VRIHLLPEGARVIEEVIEKRQTYLNGVLANFSPSETEVLRVTLRKLHDEMKEK